jgi:chemotaxis protein methyltransferase WspC
MAQHEIAELLKQVMGMDVTTFGPKVIDHAVSRRMVACKLSDLDTYREHLKGSKDEFQQLVEEVVVGETWFFRDREAFTALVQAVMNEWLPAHATGKLHVLSAPCATGEEPYSIAMALLEAGLPAGRLSIDAVDINTAALTHARHAVYGRNSFRGRDLAFRDRYFHEREKEYRLVESVRACVHFQQGNLLAEEAVAHTAGYDVIFCRNLLIYFDAPTQQRLLASLDRLLSPDGILFVGPAETFLTRARGFTSADFAGAFACRKRGTSSREAPSKPDQPMVKAKAEPTRLAKPVRKPAAEPPLEKPAASQPSPADDLATARRLADAGRLAEAEAVCEAHLREHGSSAAAYYLLGLVRDASGDERAADCYRKVIYLEPNHAEALMHLALLAEKQGDLAGARRFQMRARRVEEAAQR